MKALLTLALVLSSMTPALMADTIRTFAIGNTATSYGVLTGLVTIDTTTGTALYGDINFHYFGTDTDGHPPLSAPIDMSMSGNFVDRGPCTTCTRHPDTSQFSLASGLNADGSTYGMFFSVPTTLVDYMGGHLCSGPGCDGDAYTYFDYENVPYPSVTINGTTFPPGTFHDSQYFGNGTLSLVSEVQTPEPSTWLLLSSGALGLLKIGRRRFSKG